MPISGRTSRAARRSSELPRADAMVTPFMATVPPVGCSSSARQRSRVVLPEPDGPITQTTSFGATARLTWRSTSVGPKLFDTFSEAINGTAKSRPLAGPAQKTMMLGFAKFSVFA